MIEIVLYGMFGFVVYSHFIRPFILAKRPFVCKRCGGCCTLWVKPTKEEITRLEAAGNADFIDKLGGLKRENGYCVFLDRASKSCRVYNIKPNVCNNFPFYFKRKCADIRCNFYARKLF